MKILKKDILLISGLLLLIPNNTYASGGIEVLIILGLVYLIVIFGTWIIASLLILYVFNTSNKSRGQVFGECFGVAMLSIIPYMMIFPRINDIYEFMGIEMYYIYNMTLRYILFYIPYWLIFSCIYFIYQKFQSRNISQITK